MKGTLSDMNILYTINDNFVPQAAACMCSVCENNKEEKTICFFIAGMGISDVNKEGLIRLAESYGRICRIIDIDSIEKYLKFSFDTTGWNEIVLARLLIDELLPENVHRVIYLDGDTIVRGSLKNMWNMDMRGQTLAMSVETTVDKDRKNALGLKDYYYYNAGVLLIDLVKWRKNECGRRILEYYQEHNGRLFANDQDAINAVLRDEIRPMLPKYNFCNTYTQYPYRVLKKLVLPMPYIDRETFEECRQNPVIIHYLGEERPWRVGNKHKYREDYKKYLKMTQWSDAPDEEGWRLYFLCWGCFQTILKPFPTLRYAIINKLIPVVMKIRARKK